VQGIECDLVGRRIRVAHRDDAKDIEAKLVPLGLGASLVATVAASERDIPAPADPAREARILWSLLAINAAMFVVEIGAAWFAGSTGLLADSLDMFADAACSGREGS
jgi:hypothetical protein